MRMRSSVVFLLAVAPAVHGIGTPAAAQNDSASLQAEVIARVRDVVEQYHREFGNPGIAAAVVSDRGILWSTTLGRADTLPSAAPIDRETIFSLQSMTKGLTALAVLIAVQDGLLDLDAPIARYLPDFRINSRYETHPESLITLRHLLSHRSGIVHEAPFGNNDDQAYDFERHIASLSNSWLQFPVGYCYSYSNGGMDLAGYILQVVSRRPFARYLREKVLVPLGMTRSSADFDVIERIANRALGHWPGTAWPIPLRFSMIPAGGVYASLEDMAQYVRFHLNGGTVNGRRILREDLMREYHAIQFAAPGQRTGYALGVFRNGRIPRPAYGVNHAGGGFGFFGHWAAFPGHNLGVVALMNSVPRNSNLILGTRIEEAILRRSGTRPDFTPPRSEMTPLTATDPGVLRRVGRYGPRWPELRASPDGTVRVLNGRDTVPVEFFTYRGETIGLVGPTTAVRFLPDIGGRPGAADIYSRAWGNSNLSCNFLNDSPNDTRGPDRPEWERYLGRYEAVYHGRRLYTATVQRRNGYLYWGDQKLTEHSPGLFFMFDGWEMNFNEDPPRVGHQRLTRVGR